MLAAVKEFVKEQGDVVKMSKQIKDTPVNDFTKGDEETLKKVGDAELKWAKYFQEPATDLSKLPPQDFSLANQAKELNEIYTDVQKAADAANQKAVETGRAARAGRPGTRQEHRDEHREMAHGDPRPDRVEDGRRRSRTTTCRWRSCPRNSRT